MNTVNVIEITDVNIMSVNQLISFPDTLEGNKKAEELFFKIIEKNHSIQSTKLAEVLEDGFFWYNNYYVAIVHSSN